MNIKLRIALVASLVFFVTVTMGLYIKNAWPLNIVEIASMGIAITIILIGLGVVFRMWNSMKTDQPLHDEMSRRLDYKAGYYTWIITLYIALAVGWIIDDIPGMAPRHGSTAVLLLSAVTYFIVLLVLKTKGDFE
jgi:putative Mn2+ efflux pump MntP